MNGIKCPKCYGDSNCWNNIYKCRDCGREFGKCSNCGSYNTDRENNIWYCYQCQKGFGGPIES